MAGCGTPSEGTDTVSFAEPIESYDAESRVLVGEESADKSAEGFLVKEKKYVYFEKDVTILEVTNETQENHSVTVTSNYLDANGIGGQTVPIYYEVTDEEIDVPDYLTGDLKMIFTVDVLFTDYEEADTWLASEGAALQKHRGKYGTPTKQS